MIEVLGYASPAFSETIFKISSVWTNCPRKEGANDKAVPF